ncbi:MAG: hypothetical protein J6X30_03340 [Clostridia bacterium]|nr:hypothetical protein [Clostridia bacterium]
MIDTLLLLSDGYFKWEDGFRTMTVSCRPGVMWYADGASGMIPASAKGVRLPSPLPCAPAVCGFLLVSDDTLTPLACLPDETAFSAAVRKAYPQKRVLTRTDAPPKDDHSPAPPAEPAAASEPPVPKDGAPVLPENGAAAVPENFWDCNIEELTRLLKENPAEEGMNELIPGSRWVRVSEKGVSYLAGVIYEDETEPLYLCYGFERPWSETPPADLEGYSQWIPRDFSSPHGEGYWVIYTDAKTGARIR